MRRMWTEDEVHYDGEYYTLQGAICSPKPVQEPMIPIWVAGGGEQLTLNVAARYADYTNFGSTLDAFRHKSEVLARHCDEVGRPVGEITRSTNFNIICEETEADVQERLGDYRAHLARFVGEERAEKALKNYEVGGMAGTPDQLVEHLSEWRDAGLEYAIVYFAEAATDTSGLERFSREVIPALS